MTCTRCGKNNDDSENRFCVHCGAALPSTTGDATLVLSKQGSASEPNPKAALANARLGQVIDGNYRLDSILGSGGTGTVYRATRLKLGDEVAVKILHPEAAADATASEQFRIAAQTVLRLKHPSVVRLYDFGVTPEGLMFLVMELVEGRNLRQILKEQSPMEIRLVAEINAQICSALDEAHRVGIVHGDIKPENILVRKTATGVQVEVLDFGVTQMRSLANGNMTLTGQVVGNPRYLSPEQCMGEDLDGRSDIYSLGIVLYEMLSGSVPFNSPTATAVAIQHATQAPAPLRAVNASISPAVESVVMSALGKDRESRPKLAVAFAQRLNSVVYGVRGNEDKTDLFAAPSPSIVTQVRSGQGAAGPPAAAVDPGYSGAQRSATSPSESNRQTAAIAAAKNRSRVPLVVGGAALVLIAGLVVAGILIVPTLLNSQNKNQSVPNANNGNGKPENSPGTGTDKSADDEFNQLRERLLNATTAQKTQVRQDLTDAEARHPADYRFPYLRAKLLVDAGHDHHEAFESLYSAGKKAIAANKSDAMLADLERDGDTSFSRMTNHMEWKTMITALQNKDAGSLVLGGMLH